jgi:hypothetical protein
VGQKLYVIYDERAMLEGTDEASVCCTASTLKEAQRDCRTMFPRGVIYRYDVREEEGFASELVNETYIEGPER